VGRKLSTVSDIRLLPRYACLVIGYRRFGTHTNLNGQAVRSAWTGSRLEWWAVVLRVCRNWRFNLSTVVHPPSTVITQVWPASVSHPQSSYRDISSALPFQRIVVGCCRVLCWLQNKTLKNSKVTLADMRITSIISTYQECISEKPYVPSMTYALHWAPMVFLISYLLHFCSVTKMLVSSFGRMWGWFEAMLCAVSADHQCPGVSTQVLKQVTDGMSEGRICFRMPCFNLN